jgi:hypothetical protein
MKGFVAALLLAAAPALALQGLKAPHWGSANEVWEAPQVTYALSNITRAEVMARAQMWVDKKIPYCQCAGGPPTECCGTCPFCSDYRCDCSGYVSYCWNLGTGYVTSTLHEVAHQIGKDQLKEGDIMLYAADHVVLFGGWADASEETYYAYQEPGCHTTGPHYAFKSTVPYPFNWEPDMFLPYRYNHIVD